MNVHCKFNSTMNASRSPRSANVGFTIVELLIVIALIILLLSIVLVAMSAATRSAKNANTQALMDSMKKALIRFKGDIGYYPPVLGVPYSTSGTGSGPITSEDLRRLFPNSVPNPAPLAYTGGATYIEHMQEFFSTCALADYLIGWDHHRHDGFGRVSDTIWEAETPPLGIRHPASDGVWNATLAVPSGHAENGALNRRMGGTAYPFNPNLDQGKVFGPYLELTDERLLAGVHYGAGGLETYFPGDTLPTTPTGPMTWDTIPKAIVDYWGMPIRYYRRPYPPGAIGQSYRSVDRDGDGDADRVPTLSDVYVLRPQSIKPGAEMKNPYPDDGGGAYTTSQLDAAEFALLSTGGDRNLDQTRTIDAVDGDGDGRLEENKDNIVEVGP